MVVCPTSFHPKPAPEGRRRIARGQRSATPGWRTTPSLRPGGAPDCRGRRVTETCQTNHPVCSQNPFASLLSTTRTATGKQKLPAPAARCPRRKILLQHPAETPPCWHNPSIAPPVAARGPIPNTDDQPDRERGNREMNRLR